MWGEAWKRLRKGPSSGSPPSSRSTIPYPLPGCSPARIPRTASSERHNGPAASGRTLRLRQQGCDIYARVIYGARASVSVGVLTTIAVIIGATIGALAATGGLLPIALLAHHRRVLRSPAAVRHRVHADVRVPLIMMVVTVLAASGDGSPASPGAVMTGEERGVRHSGQGDRRLPRAHPSPHIIPNSMAPIIVYATVALGTFIVSEASPVLHGHRPAVLRDLLGRRHLGRPGVPAGRADEPLSTRAWRWR